MGTQGPRGERGPKGDPFTYDDFTPEQLESLKGPKGDPFTYDDFTPEELESLKGPKGDPFTYDDFTAEQLELLRGPKGPKGDAFTYNDFTPEQLAQLKGPKGDSFTYDDFTPEQLESLKGSKGDPFTYNDFTAEQLEQLKGPKGPKGDSFTYEDFTPEQLAQLKGQKGDPFTYNDFTEAQLESLKGPKGDKGDAFTYNDFTPEQLALLKGPKGDSFTYEDFTPEQLALLKGPKGDKGDAFTYADFTEAQLESLKGPKGDSFTYNDFTEAQLEQLKGPKGDAFTYNDFTAEQLESLKGPKGDKGDAFTYADFTVEQLASLKGPKGDPFTYDDFTPEQLEQLKGPKGDTGAPGPTYTAGTNITISADNVISATGGGGGSYTLPVATDYRLGGVKAMPTAVGNTGDDVLVDDDGRLHIPKATTRFIGGVKPDGTTIKINTNGVISAVGGSGGGYTLPTASTTTLGGVKVDGTSITIDGNGVISSTGGGEPDAYIKEASVSGNTLTLTKKDNSTVAFTPEGGSGSTTVYRFSSTDTLTQEQKNQLIDCAKNREKIAFINGELVISADIEYQDINKTIPYRTYFTTITNKDVIYDASGNTYGETSRYNYYDAPVYISTSGSIRKRNTLDTGIEEVKHISWPIQQEDIQKGKYDWMIDWAEGKKYQVWINNCLVYQISEFSNSLYLYLIGYDSGSGGYSVGSTYVYFTDDTFTQLDTTKSYSSFAMNTLLTSNNWNQYITTGGGSDWNNTTQTAWGDLYGAKELAIDWEYDGYYGCNYYNFSSNDYLGSSIYLYNNFVVGSDTSGNKCYWYYDGSQICTSNMNIRTIYYKT